MKKLLMIILWFISIQINAQIIADHTVVDKYDQILQAYIDLVKKMWVSIPGESHSGAYRYGALSLESAHPTYAVSVVESGTPEAYTTSNLRLSRATWGDYWETAIWMYSYGEEDWWTNSTAVARTKAGITYCNTHSLDLAAIGFGWCWDMLYGGPTTGVDPVYGVHWWGSSWYSPSGNLPWGLEDADNTVSGNVVNLDTYLSVTQEYIDYCTTNGYSTKVFFTTGPVDTYYTGERGYQAHLKQERIRDYVSANATRILLDYADILCYSDAGVQTTETWNGHTYPKISPENSSGIVEQGGVSVHIGAAGCLKLAKAMWWMLARMAGWDGGTATIPTVTTTAISNITNTTASSGGNVTSDGGSSVTARGVCWNTSANPTTANSHTTNGTGVGVFTSAITGLNASTLYHVRAYATNSEGTAYGSDLTFTTDVSPSVTAYYVATNGNDGNPGTLAQPWLTWNYAFNHTPAGDTCYFRGGNYVTNTGVVLEGPLNDGTYSHPTCFFNYPGEKPVLDCWTLPDATYENVGIALRRISYLKLKGLTVKNVRQYTPDDLAIGIYVSFTSNPAYAASNITFENCTVHDVGGHGWHTEYVDTLYFTNCDAYNICDSLTTYDPGGWGTGFGTYANLSGDLGTSYFYLKGCRAWQCSDQGFSAISKGLIVYDSCWAVNNGNMPFPANTVTKGSGFKWWVSPSNQKNTAILQLLWKNCLAVDNEYRGFNSADETGVKPELRVHFYNNFAYRNGKTHSNGYTYGVGFHDYTNVDTVGRWDHKYTNNLSFGNYDPDVTIGVYNSTTNYFDRTASVTSADFISLDTTGLCGARQSDGSLPITTFGHLASTSNLINAGTNVGLPYIGIAPDVGWKEYSVPDPIIEPAVVYTNAVTTGTNTATTGGNVIDDGGGTVSSRGVCWGTTGNPTITGNHTNDGSGTGTYTSLITGLSFNTTYHIRAYAINETGISYGDDIEFTTLSGTGLSGDYLFYNGKQVFKNGKAVIK